MRVRKKGKPLFGLCVRRLRIEEHADRNERRWQEVADAMGIHTVTLYNWNAGRVIPGIQSLVDLCIYFKCSLGDMIEYEKVKESP